MRRLPVLLLLAPLAVLAASCGGGGGGGSLAKSDAAVVDGEHITRDQLDHRLQQVKCSYTVQKKTFPTAGSPEYQSIQSQLLQSLVENVELRQKAPSLDVSVSDKQVGDQLKQIKKQYYGGDEKRYQADIKRNCYTDAEVRSNIRVDLVSQGIYKKVTAGVGVTDAEANEYYITHSVNYTQPQTRVVRHILVKDKQTADKLYAQLKDGADFAALAKKYSQDPGSKAQGGRLTISKGQTVPQFDQVAFALKTGEIAKPVKSQFGWHIIQALKPTTPRRATPFAQAKESVRQELLQQKRSALIQKWLDGVKKDYASKTTYATGLAPATTATTTTTPGTTG